MDTPSTEPAASLPRIIASVALQQWSGWKQKTLETLRDVAFDATMALLGYDYASLLALRDSQHSSDGIVEASECPDHAIHKGPFDVTFEEALDAFLMAHGVADGRATLTEASWKQIRARYTAPTAGWMSNYDTRDVAERVASGLNYLSSQDHPHHADLRYWVGAPRVIEGQPETATMHGLYRGPKGLRSYQKAALAALPDSFLIRA
jgi:hypothetical protein